MKLPERAQAGVKGLRVVTMLLATGLVIALALGLQSGAGRGPIPSLAAEEADAYLAIALDVRRGRREARKAGWAVARWPAWPAIDSALGSVGWSMETYMRVEAQLGAARVKLQEPELCAREYLASSAPAEHVAIVRARLDRLVEVQAPLSD